MSLTMLESVAVSRVEPSKRSHESSDASLETGSVPPRAFSEPTTSRRLRTATVADVGALHALIASHADEGHLLSRSLEELKRHASRFVVAERDGRVMGCAELASLSHEVAEVRSLVVDRTARGSGLGSSLIDELRRRAITQGFGRLCAFSHEPGYFVRLGFSIVPHLWVPEKIAIDCRGCSLFRRCGQHALVLTLRDARDRSIREASTPSGART